MNESLEVAWAAVWESRPGRWRLGPLTEHPKDGSSITAIGPLKGRRGRSGPPDTVTGTGATEVEALRNLDDKFRGIVPPPMALWEQEAWKRIRLLYYELIEGEWKAKVGRPMTAAELAEVIRRRQQVSR